MPYISKQFQFDAWHRITIHTWKCANIHGHRYKVIIILEGPIQENWMVTDFENLRRIKNRIDKNWDHAYICHSTDKYGKIMKEDWLKIFDLWKEPTAENMTQYLFHLIKKKEKMLYSVEIYETPNSSAIFYWL